MKLDIRKANRLKLPNIRYINMRKEFPNMGKDCFYSWLDFTRYWSGKIWMISVKHHIIEFDFRLSPFDDMVFPNATRSDRKAVNDAITEMKGAKDE